MNNDLDFKLDLMDQRYTLPKYFGISPRMVTQAYNSSNLLYGLKIFSS